MAQVEMFAAKANSPATELTAAITDVATTVSVLDASKLPDAPNIATIGVDESAETVRYEGKSGNTLTGVTRGFSGTVAKAWATGVGVARYFTAYDADALRENVADVNAQLADTGIDLDSRGLNVRDPRFGAIGDGDSHPLSDYFPTLATAQMKYPHAISLTNEVDWCAVQGAVNYAYDHNMFLVYVPVGEYLTDLPLIQKTKKLIDDFWWDGKGVKIVGQDMGVTKIRKTTNGVWTGMHAEINNVDATLILFNQYRDGVDDHGGESTGIHIRNIFLQNDSDSTTARAISGQACDRMLIENVNIKARQGILFDASYSNIIRNIVFDCVENATVILRGTSNTFEFLYAPGCHNPYTILSAYSNMLSVCADHATGTIFNVNGNGLVMSGCGCESPKAQYIVKNEYSGRNINTATITSLYCMRQTGDPENGLDISNCAVFYGIGHIKVDSLNILDTQEITGNSYLLDVGSAAALCSLDIGLITYYKNYSGGTTNPRLMYSKTLGNGNSSGKLHSSGIAVNVRRNKIMPYLGSFNAAQSILTGFIDKAIYLDNEDKTHSADGTDLSLQVKYNIGDWLLINNPKARNIAGYVVTDNTAGSALYVSNCTFAEVPINIVCTTATRPTSNLFPGLRVFDSTLNKSIDRNGANSAWVDGNATVV